MKIKGLFFSVLVFFLSIMFVNAEDIGIKNITMLEKSNDVTYSLDYDKTNISSNISFKNINDYIIYNIELNSDKEIKEISDNNENQYISTSYTKDNNIQMKIEYINESFIDSVSTNFDIIITYEDDTNTVINMDSDNNTSLNNGVESDNDFINLINPKTIDDILFYVFLFGISTLGIIVSIKVIKNKKVIALIAVFMLIMPFTVFALSKTTFKFNGVISFVEGNIQNIDAVYGDGTKVGDILVFDDEYYYVTNYDEVNQIVTIIPKYNLKQVDGKFVQDSTDIDFDSINGVQFDKENNRTSDYCSTPEYGCNIYEKNNNVSKDSSIKELVDKYKEQLVHSKMIKRHDNVRLITLDELDALGFESSTRDQVVYANLNAPEFMYLSTYWTGDLKEGTSQDVWFVYHGSKLSYTNASAYEPGLRPVIDIHLDQIKPKTVANGYNKIFATWLWDRSLNPIIENENTMDEAISNFKNFGIEEIYLSLMPDEFENANELKFMKKLYENGIKYYALYGDPDFILPENDYYNVIDANLIAIYNFNNKYLGQAHIEGIHYDVEYYGSKYDGEHTCNGGENEVDQRCISRNRFVDFVQKAYVRSHNYNLKVQHDINVYATNFASYYPNGGDEKHNLFDDIIDYSDDYFVMAYGRTDEDTLNFMQTTEFHFDDWSIAYPGKSFEQKLKEHNKRVIVAQDLGTFEYFAGLVESDPDRYASWVPEYGRDYKYTWELIDTMFGKITTELNRDNYKDVYIAAHDYYGLMPLYNSRNQ